MPPPAFQSISISKKGFNLQAAISVNVMLWEVFRMVLAILILSSAISLHHLSRNQDGALAGLMYFRVFWQMRYTKCIPHSTYRLNQKNNAPPCKHIHHVLGLGLGNAKNACAGPPLTGNRLFRFCESGIRNCWSLWKVEKPEDKRDDFEIKIG